MNAVRKSFKYSHELLKDQPKVLDEMLLESIKECVSKATIGAGTTTVEVDHIDTLKKWDLKTPFINYKRLEIAKMNEYIITATFKFDK